MVAADDAILVVGRGELVPQRAGHRGKKHPAVDRKPTAVDRLQLPVTQPHGARLEGGTGVSPVFQVQVAQASRLCANGINSVLQLTGS